MASRFVTTHGHWTYQLENHGNFEGEERNFPATTSTLGDFPEILVPASLGDSFLTRDPCGAQSA